MSQIEVVVHRRAFNWKKGSGYTEPLWSWEEQNWIGPVCCFSLYRIGSTHQIRNGFKAKPHQISTGYWECLCFTWVQKGVMWAHRKKVPQELLNTHATSSLRSSGAELHPDGWDALLEKHCCEPELLLGIWLAPEAAWAKWCTLLLLLLPKKVI